MFAPIPQNSSQFPCREFMEDGRRIGDVIRQHGRAHRFNTVQLGQRAELSDGYVAMLESEGNKRPGIRVMTNIAAPPDPSLDGLVRDAGLPVGKSTASFSKVTEIWHELRAPARGPCLDIGESLAVMQDAYEVDERPLRRVSERPTPIRRSEWLEVEPEANEPVAAHTKERGTAHDHKKGE